MRSGVLGFLRRTVLLPVACALGCSAPGTADAGRAWFAGDSAGARALLDARLAEDPDGRALYLNELGVLDLERRDLAAAEQRFGEAWRLMESLAGDDLDAVGAIVGSEASKQWRGDPFERAMNSWYLGLVYWWRGVHDNALACFKNAIFVDSSHGEERFDCDFAPALFLEGLAYRRLGEVGMAERSFAVARELAPGCPALAAGNDGNVIVIVEVGRGPTKVAAGKHGELTRFVAHPEVPPAIELLADGQRFGSPSRAGDVHFQASTRGGRDFDSILATKSGIKTGTEVAGIGALLLADDVKDKHQGAMVVAGAALLLASFAVRAEADTRHWTTLPHEVQLFRGTLPPGKHRFEVRPGAGWRVAGPGFEEIEVPATGEVLVYQRVLR
ncbi:MAG: hypothetical protein FJ293_03195 [Planctomycetes bacterium]|nr:hypothetical protein [Planctomycetota bacterium]